MNFASRLMAQIAIVILIAWIASPCAAADAGTATQPATTTTNFAAADADFAWKQLQQALRAPPPPANWRTNSPTQEEREAFNRRNGELAAQVADMASEFYMRFPDHPKAKEARQRELEMRKTAVQLGNVKQVARVNELEGGRGGGTQTEADQGLPLRWRSIQREALKSGPDGSTAYFNKVQEGILALAKEFPNRPEVFELMKQLLQIQAQTADGNTARALIRGIHESNATADLKTMATMVLKRFELFGKPIELKFTASDGRAVDLQKMRGKVVLIDFWASWCPPCMAEVPNMKSAYDKLHSKGFEIIGINSDDVRAQMQRVLDLGNLAWPQFFDGLGEGNKFNAEFGIITFPTMWLVDKKGVLRDLNGRSNLMEKVEKLLQENAE